MSDIKDLREILCNAHYKTWYSEGDITPQLKSKIEKLVQIIVDKPIPIEDEMVGVERTEGERGGYQTPKEALTSCKVFLTRLSSLSESKEPLDTQFWNEQLAAVAQKLNSSEENKSSVKPKSTLG